MAADQAVKMKIEGLQPGWEPGQLDEHLRAICRAGAEGNASEVMFGQYLDLVNKKLTDLNYTPLGKRDWNGLVKGAVATVKLLQPGEPANGSCGPETVKAVLADAPVPEDAVVPPGWAMRAGGINRAKDEMCPPLIPAPIVITARLVDAADRTESLRLA
jgi:hypothetical protein